MWFWYFYFPTNINSYFFLYLTNGKLIFLIILLLACMESCVWRFLLRAITCIQPGWFFVPFHISYSLGNLVPMKLRSPSMGLFILYLILLHRDLIEINGLFIIYHCHVSSGCKTFTFKDDMCCRSVSYATCPVIPQLFPVEF